MPIFYYLYNYNKSFKVVKMNDLQIFVKKGMRLKMCIWYGNSVTDVRVQQYFQLIYHLTANYHSQNRLMNENVIKACRMCYIIRSNEYFDNLSTYFFFYQYSVNIRSIYLNKLYGSVVRSHHYYYLHRSYCN